MINKQSYKILNSEKQKIVSLDFLKNYIRITHDNDDALLEEIIETAISFAEDFIKTTLVPKTIEAVVYDSSKLLLPRLPLSKILEVTIDNQYLGNDDFIVEGNYLKLKQPREKQRLAVKYIAGYENPDLIHKGIKFGLIIHIALLYDNRGNPSVMLDGVQTIYKSYREIMV